MKSKTSSIVTRLGALLLLMGATSALIFGYLGWLHPALDSFSHFRIHLAVGLLLFCPLLLVLRYWPEAAFAVLLGITAIYQTTGAPFSSPVNASQGQDERGGVYRLLHMNLRFDNATPEAALSLIGELRPDIVTLNEVSGAWLRHLSVLDAAYPNRVICEKPYHVGGVAILSRRPLKTDAETSCGDNGAFARATVDLGGRFVEVATVHLGWPWPFHQQWQLPRITPLMEEIGATAIIAADLNSVPWSNSARRVEAAANARLLRGIGPTWLDRRLPVSLRPLIGLPIDNMMVKGGVLPLNVGTVGDSGSDHAPVMLEFMVLPQEGPTPVHSSVVLAGIR